MPAPIYLDYNATTPLAPEVRAAMDAYSRENFANPSSHHLLGRAAKEAMEDARLQVARLINAEKPQCLIFTSSATESNNLALKGYAQSYGKRAAHAGKAHIVTQKTEHASVLEPLRELERSGFKVTYLDCDEQGRVDPAAVAEAIRPETILVSIMYANNEIGTIQPIREIAQICHARNIVLHCDAAQSIGKIPLDVQAEQIDLLTLSAHKMYGPKGAGALYIASRRPQIRLAPQIHGGGHERGLRSGTPAVELLVGFGKACALAQERLVEDAQHCRALKKRLWKGLQEGLTDQISLHGSLEDSLPGTLNVGIAGVEGESLLMSLSELAISSGSACESTSKKPSHVLLALGLSEQEVHHSLRFCIGRPTTAEEIDTTINYVVQKARQLIKVSSLNEGLHRLPQLESGNHA